MEACDTELRPGSDPQDQLDKVKALTNDVIAEGKKVEDLKRVRSFRTHQRMDQIELLHVPMSLVAFDIFAPCAN